MIINENLIKYMFNKENLIKRFFTNAILIVLFIILGFIFVYNSYKVLYMHYYDIITNNNIVYNTEISKESNKYKDIMSNCLAIKCDKMIMLGDDNEYNAFEIEYDNNNQYNYLAYDEEFEFRTIGFTKYLTDDLKLIIYTDDINYIIDNSYYIENTLYSLLFMIVLSAVIFVIVNFYSSYISFKNNIYEKKNYKNYVENKLQGNVTEMIHHEINAPLAILTTLNSTIKDILDGKICIEKSQKDKIIESYNYGINRITEVVAFLAKSKHFKRDNDVDIYDVFEHLVYSINTTHILKTDIEYIDCKELLSSYIVNPKLGNASFMNIITVLFNNSIEAGANLMSIKVHELDYFYMTLDVKDNGRGIRDTNNNLFKDSGKIIEQYGYSTKDAKGNQIVKKGFLYTLLRWFKITVVCTDSNRGIGLYMNKILLSTVNGDIKLLETSENGTTFRIKIPVQKKK